MKTFAQSILLCSIILNSENGITTEDKESLEKYSYHLIGINWDKGIVYNSTGFFVRRDKRLFFITASHALTGWNPMQLTGDPNYPDNIELIMKGRIDNKIKTFNLNLKPYKENAKINVIEHADIQIIEFDKALEEQFHINSIENFMNSTVLEKDHPMEIIGFTHSYPPGTHLREIIKDNGKSGVLEFLDDKKAGATNYEAQTISGVVTQGFSGAPVFSISKETGSSIHFNGVCIGGEPGNPQYPKILVVNPKVVNAAIDENISKSTNINKGIPSYLKEWIKNNGL